MNIILEGIDGSGKTTLANKLVKEFGFNYQHETEPKNKEYYLEQLDKDNFIFDRFCFSQFMPHCFGMPRILVSKDVMQICKKIHKNTILILCDTNTYCYNVDINIILNYFVYNENELDIRPLIYQNDSIIEEDTNFNFFQKHLYDKTKKIINFINKGV